MSEQFVGCAGGATVVIAGAPLLSEAVDLSQLFTVDVAIEALLDLRMMFASDCEAEPLPVFLKYMPSWVSFR